MAENFNNTPIEDNESMVEEYLVDLFDEDGTKQTVVHLDTVQVNGLDYVICIPYKEEDDDEVDEVFILKMEKDENGENVLLPEEDDEVLDKAYEIFKERNADMFDFED